MNELLISDARLSFQDVCNFITHQPPLTISSGAKEKVRRCRDYLEKRLNQKHERIYGINTGFGFLQNIEIDKEQIRQLQYNLLQSHACGLGDEVPKDIIRLMLMLKIKSLCYGYSGVTMETVGRLTEMYNSSVLPVIFTQGSLGASGDLAPLSHLSLPLIGLGKVWIDDEKKEASDVLPQHSWQPLSLQSKEGLALINGTQFMSAYGMYGLYKASQLLALADIISSVSFDAFHCCTDPLHEAIHAIRPHKGQLQTAARLRQLLKGSGIAEQCKPQVQDPYSFRCIPQVHGATKDVFETVLNVFLTEINSVTDNPNIFPEEDLILSGGNFHGQTLAMHLDFLSIAMSEIASISERRTYQLISGQRGLPLFLVQNAGLHSGLMIPQYTAAGIVSENKQLCAPSSVDSIPSSNNQEDHVSMGANAAVKCLRVIENTEKVLAIELLTAAQALDFRRPERSSDFIEDVISRFRDVVSFNNADRVLHEDMRRTIDFIRAFPETSLSDS